MTNSNTPPPLRIQQKTTSSGISTLIAVAAVSLIIGGVAGFFIGIATTKAGRDFLLNVIECERKADITAPLHVDRDMFEVKYPGNWKIDTDDEDFDPDSMFSIDSPGSTFVLFSLGNGDLDTEENLQTYVEQFSNLMSRASFDRFERYGGLTGKGTVIKGRIMGMRTTVKIFSFGTNGFNANIVQQYPDEDLMRVKEGLALIENSFRIKNQTAEVPEK